MSKKGFVLSNNDTLSSQKINALNVKWYYNWGYNKNNDINNIPFVPMIWSDKNVTDSIINQLCITVDNVLLGFNEPDFIKQSNMTVDEAISLWGQLEKTGKRLGSPATAKNASDPNGWQYDFMTKIKQNNMRVDFIAVHWYAPPNASGFLNQIDKIYNTYKLPIWITEFSPADWNASITTPSKYTSDDAINFMKIVIPELERREYVERYSWKTRATSDPNLGFAALFNDDGSLTNVGVAYANI